MMPRFFYAMYLPYQRQLLFLGWKRWGSLLLAGYQIKATYHHNKKSYQHPETLECAQEELRFCLACQLSSLTLTPDV